MSLMDKLRELFGGKPKGPAERAGEKIDRAAQQAKDKIEQGVARAGDKLIETGKKLKDSAD